MSNEIIESAMSEITCRVVDALAHVQAAMTDPSVMYRPKLSIDGDMWCALYGENLQDGVAGFGVSPSAAIFDFNRAWYAQLGVKP
ncbi:TPA: hypothetical protein ACXI3M_006680 [Pseudomonas aeruginosa]